MKIKSLLLGSAAALMAVTTVQAADAIVVEPEPVDYVRVCDAYGSGFFFIPGTETCMNINGFVRTTYAAGHSELDYDRTFLAFATPEEVVAGANLNATAGAIFAWEAANGAVTVPAVVGEVVASVNAEGDNHAWNYRGRLNIDVRNETEYGTLRSQLRLQGGDTNDQDAPVGIDRALISLAGFNLGYSDAYWATNHGYGAGSPAVNDGFYNYDQAIFFDYTWAQDGLAVTVGVQDSSSGGSFSGATGTAYADFYAGLNYSADFGTFAFTALHDSDAIDEDGDRGIWAYKASLQLDLSEFVPGGQLGVWYAAADSPFHQNVTGYGTLSSAIFGNSFGFDSQWGVQIKGNLADNLTGYALYSAADLDFSVSTFDVEESSSLIAVGLVWAPVTGLTIQTEYTRRENDLESDVNGLDFVDADSSSDAFIVRVTRSW